jgi:MYXO-CTERM domain-containing protein
MAYPGFTLWSATSLMLAAAGAPALAAPGDSCAEATEIATLPFASNGSTCGAGDDFNNESGGAALCSDLPKGYGGDDVFFKLTLQQGNQVAFDLSLPAGSNGDLALFLMRAPSCADPLVCAGNSVDLIGAGVGPERIKTNAQAYPTGTYYLIVDSKLSAPDPASCGAYALTVTGHLSAFCGNGSVDPGEVCDDGNNDDRDCCAADCLSKAAAGTVCHGLAGLCDVEETCNADGTCPVNAVKLAGTSCRPANGPCDVAEVCDGVTPACGVDRFLAGGTVCRPGQGICDQTETCSGVGPDCPTNGFKATGTPCGAASTCQKAPICNGSGSCLPGGQISCDDSNSCTSDSCSPFFGCLHAPICQDSGVDAGGADGAPDSASPDSPPPDLSLLPADTAAPDTDMKSLVPDAALPPADVAPAPGDAAFDGPPASADGSPVVDSGGSAPDGSPAPPDVVGAIPDGSVGGAESGGDVGVAQEGGPGGRSPLLSLDGGTSLFAEKGGCSCRVGAQGRSTGDSSAAVMALALMALVALRRRST